MDPVGGFLLTLWVMSIGLFTAFLLAALWDFISYMRRTRGNRYTTRPRVADDGAPVRGRVVRLVRK
jgi:hypothetical protein